MQKRENILVLFFDKGEIHIGLIKDEKSYGKILILSEDGKEKFITPKQVFRKFVVPEPFSFDEFIRKVGDLRKEIDIKVIWEVAYSSFPDTRTLTEQDMLSILFSDFSVQEHVALLMELKSKKNIFFKYDDGVWIVRDEEMVRKLEQELESEERNDMEINEMRKWLSVVRDELKKVSQMNLKNFFKVPQKYDGEIPPIPKAFLNELKDFLLKGVVSERVKKALSGFIELKPHEVFKMLCFFNVVDPFYNWFVEKFSLDIRDLDIDISPYKIFELERDNRTNIEYPTFSVDIEGTEVRDDAISIPPGESGRVLVHVADTTLLDLPEIIDAVVKRGKTIYFPEGKIDMLPVEAVRELSLDAGVCKPAITFDISFVVSDQGIKIKNVDVKRTEILVQRNFEFSNCDFPELKHMGLEIWKCRIRAGGLDLISDDLALFLDRDKIISQRWSVSDYRIALSELMMLCSAAIGKFCRENSIPAFFRRSKIRDEEKEEIRRFNIQAYEMGLPRPFIIWRNIRSARHIETTVDPAGAETIGYNLYAWGTSPLRRGWDFINIMQIGRFIDGKKLLTKDELAYLKEKMEVSISRVESAEQKRYMFILCVYIMLSDKVYDGIVVDVQGAERGKGGEMGRSGGRNAVFWVDDLAMFLRGTAPESFEPLSSVKLKISADPITEQIIAKVLL